MSNPWIAFAGIALVLICPSRSNGQEGELTPVETIKLLEKVESIGDTLHEKRSGTHALSITAFREGTESPTAAYQFYLKCHKLVEFENKGRSDSEYRDWKDRRVKELRGKPHAEARRLQLSFLVLTLRAAQIQEAGDRYGMGAELLSLADQCIAHYADAGRENRRVMHENAVSSMYGRAYKLSSTLGGFEDWPSAPLDLQGIYEYVVLPPFRVTKNAAELAKIWDRRMAQQVRLIQALEDPEREIKFTELELPRLRWSKNVDLLKAGDHKTAVNTMVAMIQLHLDHPDVDGWLQSLKDYLSGVTEYPELPVE